MSTQGRVGQGPEVGIINCAEGMEMDGPEKLQKEDNFSCHECLFLSLNSLDEEQITHDQQSKTDYVFFFFTSTKWNSVKVK